MDRDSTEQPSPSPISAAPTEEHPGRSDRAGPGRPSEESAAATADDDAPGGTTAAAVEAEATADVVEVVHICVPLPSSSDAASVVPPPGASLASLPEEGEPASALAAAAAGAPCVVGTVTVLGRSSAVVWIGWGVAAATDGDDDAVARSSLPPMGPLVVSMPRTRYAGRTSSPAAEAPSSQLIGGESDEDQMTSWQMASRLSKKIGWPVFVSCSLAAGGGGSVPPATSAGGGGGMGGGGMGGGGGDAMSGLGDALGGLAGLGGTDAASKRAAALAEREVGRILLQRKSNVAG